MATSGNANAAYTANRVAMAAAQEAAAATPQALPPGVGYGAPDWLEVYDGMSAPPTPGQNGYGPEPSLAALPYGAVGGVGSGAPSVGAASSSASSQAGAQGLTSDAAYNWLVAWIVLGVLIALIIRTQVGYRLVYYGVALSLLFLVVTNYKWIAAALAPFDNLPQKVAS